MLERNLTIIQLLQELDQKLKTKEIGFWIDGQDCYLWENTFHYVNKIKIGDLSLTKKNYWMKRMAEFDQYYQKSLIRDKFLTSKFQEISDVELIDELEERAQKNRIKLSMYSGDKTIWIEGEDIECGTCTPLPIEIKEKDHDWK